MTLSAIQYARQEMRKDRFPTLRIVNGVGVFYLADADERLLKDAGFASRDAARAAISKILDRAARAHWAAVRKAAA